MFARICVIVLALLLCAAPADRAYAEIQDNQSASLALLDDDALTQICVLPSTAGLERVPCTSIASDSIPLAPALARVFRPPRLSID
ncbi:MAG: hypothetical protein AB7O24_11150 [Kofleriaceae bacterium]